jgi:galactokinase
MKNIPALREKVGDRAILRALHFFAENDRVAGQKSALKSGDLAKYFSGVLASGRSSYCYLQNVYTTANVAEQGISLALNLCESYLSGLDKPTAWRVHGGGFAGTVQAYVPMESAEGFVKFLEGVFGEGSCYLLKIRLSGAVRIF